MDIQIFAIHSTEEWGAKVAAHLNQKLALHEERDFDDGEHKMRTLESVRGRNIFLVQSLFTDDKLSVNDKICRLLFFIGALKDASANQINVVIPYFAYARKDRKTKSRDPVTMRYMAQLLEAVGADRILTIDIHNLSAFQNAFRIPTDHLEARVLFAPYFAKLINNEKVVVVSPDAGGLKRAEDFRITLSDFLQRDVEQAFLEKKRNDDEVIGGQQIMGNVEGHIAIIVDDMICTGSTMLLAIDALHKKKVKRIFACATHGLFTDGAEKIVSDPRIEKIVITNTVQPLCLKLESWGNKVDVLDASQLFAQAIKRIFEGGSIVNLMEEYPPKINEIS